MSGRIPSIGILLTCYKRPQLLSDQLAAIRRQTVPYKELVVWANYDACHENSLFLSEAFSSIAETPSASLIRCSKNWGVWPRFVATTFLDCEYYAVFDDDTMPGHDWLLNCLDTLDALKTDPLVKDWRMSLLGTCGILFPDGTRDSAVGVGWKYPSNETMIADLIGHAWFFSRELAKEFVVCHDYGPSCGEDYALSYLARKHGGAVCCPPHPPEQRELWGSLRGMELGCDDVALWRQPGEPEKKQFVHDSLRANGWPVATELFEVQQ
jgi:hypothetical protein